MTYECAILELLDLKSKKELQLSHHGHLKSIRILLAYAAHHDFKLYQMDVKSAFFNGPLFELVYVEQPPGFEDPKYPTMSTSSTRRSMGSNKPLELSMIA